MPKCKSCNGRGYQDSNNYCHTCNGTGSVNWWETEEYRRTGRIPKEEVNTDKGFSELGLVGGAIFGLGVYLLTYNSTLAIIIGIISAVLAATILKFIFKYIVAILAIGYVLYLIFA